jgi:small conductance mechanosensitive channel
VGWRERAGGLMRGRADELSRALLGLVAAIGVSPAGARAEQGGPQEELAVAIENTTERIDVVGDKLAQLGERAIELVPLLAVALVTVLLFVLVAQLFTRSDLLFRWIRNRFVRDLARHFARITVIGAGVLLALELLDATALVGAALGAAGVVGIAVGFAFRDIIENYLAGLLLSMRHPFEANDFVSIDGDEGKVVRLTSRATILLTLAGNHLRIPNSRVFKAVLVNYTQNPFRRIDFDVNVGPNDDLAEAQKIGVDALSAMPAIIDEPAPLGLVERLGDSSIVLHFYAWVDQRETDFFKAQSEAIRIVKVAFDEAGVEMPPPSYQVMLSREAERPAPEIARPQVKALELGDTAADVRLDEQVESERAAQGPDLLDADAPRE